MAGILARLTTQKVGTGCQSLAVALFAVLLHYSAASEMPQDERVAATIPPSPQRSGNAERGYRYVLTGNYVRSGPPLEFVASTSPRTDEELGRTGDNARLPYFLTATTAPNGTRIAVPNCLQCHADRLNGKLIVGLGNATRNYTVNFALGTRIPRNEIVSKFGRGSPEYASFETLHDVMLIVGPQIRTHVKGVNPADKLAFVLAAHRDPETLAWSDEPLLQLPPAEQVVPTDVPALWLMHKKNSMFYTALGRGDFARLTMAASLLTVSGVEELRAIDSDFVDVAAWIDSVPAPKWVGSIDGALAGRGERLFNERCSTCHGTYGRKVSYPNRLVPLDLVGTDPALAESQFTDYAAAIESFNRSWFAQAPDGARLVPERGYLAPPLDGVWATAPYLHNGSVPGLMELLDSTRRPTYWQRRRGPMDYDLTRVGLRYKRRKWQANKQVYDTTVPGYGNQGHTFGDSLSDDERRAMIEYLKLL